MKKKFGDDSAKMVGHFFGYDKDKYPPFYMQWVEMMGMIVNNMGIAKPGEWHTVDFYFMTDGKDKFYMDSFRISNIKRRKK